MGEGNGETTKVLTLLVPWKKSVNLAVERIIADDDDGMCEEGDEGLPCYSNQRKISFLPSQREYFDLELTLSGTDLRASENSRSWRPRNVAGVEVLVFHEGKYLQVSRTGELTGLDHAVAARENLK